MSITREEVQELAELAKLYMDEADLNAATRDLEGLLQFVSAISEVDTSTVEATIYGVDTQNVFRQDVVVPSYDRDVFLQGAPEHEEGQFLVPKVV